MRLTNIIDFLSFNKNNVVIIGSYDDDTLIYPSDIDMHETIHWNDNSKNGIKDIFQTIFFNALSNDVYITDFKCGIVNGQVMRWSFNDIMRGYKDINIGNRVKFLDMFDHKSTIKLDILYLLKGIYTEITINYFFYFRNDTNTKINEYSTPLKAFYYDYRQQMNEKNYLKALKRLYKYFVVAKDEKYIDILRNFLNSYAGKLNYYLINLKNIQLLIKKYSKYIELNPIKKNLIIITLNIFDNNKIKYKKIIDNLTNVDDIYSLINQMITQIEPIINDYSLQFIKSNKLKSKHIIKSLYKL